LALPAAASPAAIATLVPTSSMPDNVATRKFFMTLSPQNCERKILNAYSLRPDTLCKFSAHQYLLL
jgi:hypothetical protein